MISPCVRLCTLNLDGSLCVGCGRTLAEIGAWSGYSDEERQAIMNKLPARLAARRAAFADAPASRHEPRR
jgi:predicted Fe-S protein YdhL (DUF1289 family)